MKNYLLIVFVFTAITSSAQKPVDFSGYNKNGGTKVVVKGQLINVNWPASQGSRGQLILDMEKGHPLFKSIKLGNKSTLKEIAANLDPAFILTIGKRTLSPSSGGWDVFFDRVPKKPHQSYNVQFDKRNISIKTAGAHTIIRIGDMQSATFKGALEITLYNGK